MSYISWDSSKELGHPQVDAEHEAMLAKLNRLVDVVFQVGHDDGPNGGDRLRCIEDAVADLRQATVTHFASEEALMEKADFPAMRHHVEVHADLIEQLDRFAEHFHSTNADSLPHAVRFLREWFEFHIDTYDRALVRWVMTGEDFGGSVED